MNVVWVNPFSAAANIDKAWLWGFAVESGLKAASATLQEKIISVAEADENIQDEAIFQIADDIEESIEPFKGELQTRPGSELPASVSTSSRRGVSIGLPTLVMLIFFRKHPEL